MDKYWDVCLDGSKNRWLDRKTVRYIERSIERWMDRKMEGGKLELLSI